MGPTLRTAEHTRRITFTCQTSWRQRTKRRYHAENLVPLPL